MRSFGLFFRTILFAGFFAGFLTLSAGQARADWPSAEDVLIAVGPLAGLDGNEIEAVKFFLKEPACAGTILSYTAAQDYSLVAFIGALKAAKLDNLPIPKMSQATCKSYGPVERLYITIDTVGNSLLGAEKANALRELLQQQIAEGKAALEGKLAAIPYVGPVLTNWNCACDAAYMTKFPIEDMANSRVGLLIAIVTDVKNGDYGGALGKMVTTLGPEVACELGAQWTGVGAIPVVSDIAAKACSSVAGEVVGWVVDAGGTMAEAVGIIGGEHIPPAQYYDQMFRPQLGKDGFMELSGILYDKCYSYFEPTNMAAGTAKKACGVLKARYIEESLGKLEWDARAKEFYPYGQQNVKPRGEAGAMLDDAAFEQEKQAVDVACEAYFSQKYTKVAIYEKAYPPAGGYVPGHCDYDLSMEKYRREAQIKRVNEVTAKLTPFCKKGSAFNAVLCSGQQIEACFDELPGICAKDDKGMQRPCCQLGDGEEASFKYNAAYAEKLARQSGGPYCTTSKADPLRVTCVLQETYQACKSAATQLNDMDCGKSLSPTGAATRVCCEFDPAGLTKVDGVMKALKTVKDINNSGPGMKDVCGIGGFLAGLSYDPRIVHCRSDVVDACRKTLGDGCYKGDAGFVNAPCCDLSVFEGVPVAYDPAQRDAESLALAAKIVKESNGNCDFGKGPDGTPDYFKVVCKTINSAKTCTVKMGRPAKTPCSAKTAANGWVTSPCCARSGSALSMDAPKGPPKQVEAVDQKKLDVGLGAQKGGGLGTRKSVPSTQKPELERAAGGLAKPGKPVKGAAPDTLRTAPSATPSRSGPTRGSAAPGRRDSTPERATTEEETGNYKP